MPETLYGLTEAQIERLKRLLNSVEGDGQPPLSKGSGRRPQAGRVAAGALTSSVASAGLFGTPTVGELNVYTFSSTGKVDTGINLVVYNMAPAAATTDRWTIAERDNYAGKWIITTQFCS